VARHGSMKPSEDCVKVTAESMKGAPILGPFVSAATVRAALGRLSSLSVFTMKIHFCVGLLYGRAGHLTAISGPGPLCKVLRRRVRSLAMGGAAIMLDTPH
jgi:hypothetical protein